MANPKEMLKGAMYGRKMADKPMNDDAIHCLICKAFTTRNLTHFAHWASDSYSQHMALGDLYDEIEDVMDDVVEAYQGKFGLVKGAYTESAVVPDNILERVENEAKWIAMNREQISNGCDGVAAILDTLEGAYLKAIYKIKNLR